MDLGSDSDGSDTCSSDHLESDHVITNEVEKKKKRGPTTMSRLKPERAKKKQKIEFDERGEPCGNNAAPFKSFIGGLARAKVDINIKKWDKVPDDTTNRIWQEILCTWDVTPTEASKEKWLSYAGKRWGDFKAKLTNRYIYGEKKEENPCEFYKFLKTETWKKFYEERTKPYWKVKRAIYQERQAKNVYPHTMSRGGYNKLKKKMKKKKFEELQEASKSDPSIVLQAPKSPPRWELWVEGRKKKDGSYMTKEVEEVAEKINDYVQQDSQGTFIQSGRMDILNSALGKDEHPGRVRGVAGNVGIKEYYGGVKRRGQASSSSFDMVELENKIREKLRAEMEAFWQEKMSIAHIQSSHHSEGVNLVDGFPPPVQSMKASCEPCPFDDVPTTGAKCRLYLEDPTRRVVAHGRAYKLDSIDPTPGELLRVLVDTAIVEDAAVPIPTEDFVVVRDALMSFLMWPKNLVELDPSEEYEQCNSDKRNGHSGKSNESVARTPVHKSNHGHKQKKKQKKLPIQYPEVDASSLTKECRKLNSMAKFMRNDATIEVHMGKGIVGSEIEYDIFLSKMEIKQFLAMDELDIVCIQLFLIYLHDVRTSLSCVDMYGLLCPQRVQGVGLKELERSGYITKVLEEGKHKFYLVPVLEGDTGCCVSYVPLPTRSTGLIR